MGATSPAELPRPGSDWSPGTSRIQRHPSAAPELCSSLRTQHPPQARQSESTAGHRLLQPCQAEIVSQPAVQEQPVHGPEPSGAEITGQGTRGARGDKREAAVSERGAPRAGRRRAGSHGVQRAQLHSHQGEKPNHIRKTGGTARNCLPASLPGYENVSQPYRCHTGPATGSCTTELCQLCKLPRCPQSSHEGTNPSCSRRYLVTRAQRSYGRSRAQPRPPADPARALGTARGSPGAGRAEQLSKQTPQQRSTLRHSFHSECPPPSRPRRVPEAWLSSVRGAAG